MATPYHRCPIVGSADGAKAESALDAFRQRFLLPPLAQR
jgi:hypothetical protein